MNITTQQARLRFTTIPSRLQDAMFSEQTDEIMDGIAQQYHLDEIKSDAIGKIAGWVMLGFIHPGDVSREIQQQLSLSPQAAVEISKSLDAKIFSALRDDLSKAYAPAASSDNAIDGPIIVQEVVPPAKGMAAPIPAPAPLAPKMISEGFSATAMGAPKVSATGMPPKPPAPSAAPQPKPQQVFSQTAAAGGMSLGSSPLASNKNVAGTAPQPTKPGSEKGWSKQTNQDPVVKLGIITPSVPTPTANKMESVTPTIQPTTPAEKGMSEFERIDMMKKSAGGGMAVPPPPPVMLHEVSPGTASQASPDFHISTGMQNQFTKTATPPPAPVKSAVLEFGTTKPVPPTPPAPANKVIVKDFLAPENPPQK